MTTEPPTEFTVVEALRVTAANTPAATTSMPENTDDPVSRFPTEAAESFGDALDGKVDGESVPFVVP